MRPSKIYSTLAFSALPVLLAMAGCTSLEQGAKEHFAQEFSCPMERIEVRKRDDLQPSEVSLGGQAKPPAEVAKDPERLAVWKKDQQKYADDMNDRMTVFELRGCGHRVLYSCARAAKSNGGNGIGCFPGDYPSGATKW